MRISVLLLFILVIAGCKDAGDTNTQKDSTVTVHADTVALTRQTVSKNPVAIHSEKVPDELNNWKFEVAIYETSQTFSFLVRMQYKELRITDSLQVPDLGVLPKVDIRDGKEPMSCVIGFMDKKNEFKEYKLVRIKNDQLKVTTINHYYVGHTRTRVNQAAQ